MPFWTQRPHPHPYPDVAVQNPVAGLQLLGPYRVAHDTPDFVNTGVLLSPVLEAGTVIVALWAVPASSENPWDDDEGDMEIGLADDALAYTGLIDYMPQGAATWQGNNGDPDVEYSSTMVATAFKKAIVSGVRNKIFAVFWESGSLTEGVADIYALIVESA